MEERGAALSELGDREGWQREGWAARVHYSGPAARYSVEYYAPSDCVLYWKIPPAGENNRDGDEGGGGNGDRDEAGRGQTNGTEGEAGRTAVPVGRSTVPAGLRERIREDLAAAGIDPDRERQTL